MFKLEFELDWLPYTGHCAGPAVPRVPEAVEEDDGGGVLPAGGHHYRLRHPGQEGLGAHSQTLTFNQGRIFTYCYNYKIVNKNYITICICNFLQIFF